MANNVIEVIKDVFLNLEKFVIAEDRDRVISTSSRLIVKRLENHETNFEIIKNCNIEQSIVVSFKSYVTGLTVNDKSYILMPGISDFKETFSNGFIKNVTEDEIMAEGFMIFSISKQLVNIKPDPEVSLKLVDRIFGLPLDSADKVEYYLSEILFFYEEFEIWEVDNQIFNVKNEEDLYRAYILWRISNEKEKYIEHKFDLDFSFEVLEQITILTNTKQSIYIILVLYRALTSTSWQHCYLELYRCIEQLYTIYHIDFLTNKLEVETNVVADSLDSIGFKGREINDVKKIFRSIEINKDLILDLKSVFSNGTSDRKEALRININSLDRIKTFLKEGSTEESEDLYRLLETEIKKSSEENIDKSILGIAEKLYLLRCSIAHLSYRHYHYEFDKAQWNKIIYTVLKVIEELYLKFGHRFDEIK